MSKGSKPRPRQVTFDEYAENWDRVFKKEMPVCDGLDCWCCCYEGEEPANCRYSAE